MCQCMGRQRRATTDGDARQMHMHAGQAQALLRVMLVPDDLSALAQQ
jgi:hypothetical protein